MSVNHTGAICANKTSNSLDCNHYFETMAVKAAMPGWEIHFLLFVFMNPPRGSPGGFALPRIIGFRQGEASG
jgi:hypothetical protein